jgi:hypothetical protein
MKLKKSGWSIHFFLNLYGFFGFALHGFLVFRFILFLGFGGKLAPELERWSVE